MANDFDLIKGTAASEKFNLIRMTPARYVSGDLTLLTGTVYQMTFFWPYISHIQVDGVTYTKIISVGNPGSGQFTFNESTMLLKINFGSALTTQVVIVFYHIFLTQQQHRQTFENPEDDATETRRWEPRISKTPQFSFNIRDVQEGILSFGVSGIELSNQDGFFNQFLSNKDSFSNKAIVVWLCLDKTTNVRRVFKGIIKKVQGTKKLQVDFYDEFSTLSRSYFSNETFIESTYNLSNFPALIPVRDNTPIYRLFAETTYYKVINEGTLGGLFRVDPNRLIEAVAIAYTNTISVTTNREYGTVLNEGDGGQQSDVVLAANHAGGYYSVLDYTPGKKYKIGDTLKVGIYHVRVFYVDSGPSQIYCTYETNIVGGETITRPGVSAVVITQNNVHYYALFDRDYTVDYTGNPNDIIKIVFVDDVETTLGIPQPINPNVDLIRFRAWCDTGKSLNHGDVMETILTEAGLSVNAASIAAANATNLQTNFYIPFVGQPFTSFTEVIQKLLFSTFGYLTLNNDLEFEYHLFEAPSPTREVTDDQILLDSFNTIIEYQDLRDSITPSNLHDIIELGFENTSLQSNLTRYLHEISTNRTYEHILATTVRMATLFNYIKERKVFYLFRTKTNPDEIIGNDLEIVRDKLIGNDDSKNVKIIGILKKTNEVDFMATDLFGL